MRWDDFRRSDNVDDRRDDGGGGFGGGGGFPVGRGGLGIGTVVVLGLVGWALGIDPRLLIGVADMVSGGGGMSYEQSAPQRRADQGAGRSTGAPKDEMGDFMAAILGDIDDRWAEIFKSDGQTYRGARLVLFRNATDAQRCGPAQAAMGPFYCPPDRQIFIDTSFFDEIESRFRGCSGKACKFTQAYIVAHEVGHHVQNLLGILTKVQQLQQSGVSKVEANRLQVRVELQADCFAGIWANRSEARRSFIDPGDIDAALQTAAAIGDDTLQRKAQGRVVPDSFTHGSAEQRKRWFQVGFQSGRVSSCNTFAQDVRL